MASLLDEQANARSDRDRKIFYTALYHTALMPAVASDADGSYRGIDGNVHSLPAGTRTMSDFSLWDTYRTLHAVDGAVMLLDCAKGVEAQTRKLFRVCRQHGLDYVVCITLHVTQIKFQPLAE